MAWEGRSSALALSCQSSTALYHLLLDIYPQSFYGQRQNHHLPSNVFPVMCPHLSERYYLSFHQPDYWDSITPVLLNLNLYILFVASSPLPVSTASSLVQASIALFYESLLQPP